MFLFEFTLLAILVRPLLSYGHEESNCTIQRRCNECIRTPSCAWCSDPDFTGAARCFDSSTNFNCQADLIWYPDNIYTVTGHELNAIVSPQAVDFKLRTNEPYSFKMQYKEVNRLQKQTYSSTVELKDNSTSPIKITYYSRCTNSSEPETETNKCDDVKVGDVVTFRLEIEVESCPNDPRDWNQILQIYPVGVRESLVANVQMHCVCPCEVPGNPGYEENSSRCHHSGTYTCGVCECRTWKFGQTCECEYNPQDYTIYTCAPNNQTYSVCSGRGTCICNRCECDVRPNWSELIYGAYCECDNFSCSRHRGDICGGPEHGTCDCGECRCREPWGGPACDCKLSNDTCIGPSTTEICNGHGECVCGACRCKDSYSGRYCEVCPNSR